MASSSEISRPLDIFLTYKHRSLGVRNCAAPLSRTQPPSKVCVCVTYCVLSVCLVYGSRTSETTRAAPPFAIERLVGSPRSPSTSVDASCPARTSFLGRPGRRTYGRTRRSTPYVFIYLFIPAQRKGQTGGAGGVCFALVLFSFSQDWKKRSKIYLYVFFFNTKKNKYLLVWSNYCIYRLVLLECNAKKKKTAFLNRHALLQL